MDYNHQMMRRIANQHHSRTYTPDDTALNTPTNAEFISSKKPNDSISPKKHRKTIKSKSSRTKLISPTQLSSTTCKRPDYPLSTTVHVVYPAMETSPYELPIPVVHAPIVTIPTTLSFLAHNITVPEPVAFPLPVFGDDRTTQARYTKKFFHLLIDLVKKKDAPAIEELLIQLGKDCRKYSMTKKDISSLVTSWQTSFPPTTHHQFVSWLRGLERPLCVGLNTYTPLVSARVYECVKPEKDLLIIRLLTQEPLKMSSGQYCEVISERHPNNWRYLANAVAANPLGKLEFHIRGSEHIFCDTAVGDMWQIGQIHGEISEIPYRSERVLLIGYDTGLAPFRSIIDEQLNLPHTIPITLYSVQQHNRWYDRELLLDAAHAKSWFTVVEDIVPEGYHINEQLFNDIYYRNTTAHIILSGPVKFMTMCLEILMKNKADASRIYCIQPEILGITTNTDQWNQR